MKNKNHIIMLNRNQLEPHPDNPRKDLGDLEELKESIREHGIMQNLTVVPKGDGLIDSGDYRILIGHRRFAASEGILEELPCVIAEGLTDREQVGIMLCENMQRSDLTYLEQAHGFQMMLDLGDTVETISKKTGFSKTTIKHRLSINEIKQESLDEALKWFQPTITDFIDLEKVDDIKKRNEILEEAMCSRDIHEEVEGYLKDKKHDSNYKYYKKIFEEAGWTESDDQWFYYKDGYKRTETALDDLDLDHDLIPEDKVKGLIEKIKGDIYFAMTYTSIKVRSYKEPKEKKSEVDAEKKRKEKEALIKKNKAALKEIQASLCDAYLEFILNSEVELDDPKDELGYFYNLLDICRDGLACTIYELTDEKIQYQLRDKVSNKGYNLPEKHCFKDFVNWTPLFQLLSNLWWSLASSYNYLVDYDGKPKRDMIEAHKSFCQLLHDLGGFHIRDEWKSIFDYSSDLFISEDK